RCRGMTGLRAVLTARAVPRAAPLEAEMLSSALRKPGVTDVACRWHGNATEVLWAEGDRRVGLQESQLRRFVMPRWAVALVALLPVCVISFVIWTRCWATGGRGFYVVTRLDGPQHRTQVLYTGCRPYPTREAAEAAVRNGSAKEPAAVFTIVE